jgi:hypothetical protein
VNEKNMLHKQESLYSMESNQFTKLTASWNFLNVCSSIIQHIYKVEKNEEGSLMRDPTVMIEKSVDDDDDDDDNTITVDRLVVCWLNLKIHMIQERGAYYSYSLWFCTFYDFSSNYNIIFMICKGMRF